MQVGIRIVLVWLLALALPVQGFASAAMAHCGQSHQQMHPAGAGAGHSHGNGAAAPHHHDTASAGAATHAASPQHEAAQLAKFTDLGQYKCSACASCCSAVALPTGMPDVPEPATPPAVFAPDVPSVADFAVGGPDRPPRTEVA
jgi:hypothetical protein